MSTILIVEDMQEVNDMLKEYLEKDGKTCLQAFSGSEAKLLLEKHSFDLILLDLMLPAISGEQILKEIKSYDSVPIIIVSAKDGIDIKVDMLELGADDYICKPFDLQEVLARIHVQLRKVSKDNSQQDSIDLSGLKLNLLTYQVSVKDHVISLTKHEFLILRLLMENPNQVFTKQVIYEFAWEEDYYGDERVINTHIGNLRAKLRSLSDIDFIQTVWGIGFKFHNE